MTGITRQLLQEIKKGRVDLDDSDQINAEKLHCTIQSYRHAKMIFYNEIGINLFYCNIITAYHEAGHAVAEHFLSKREVYLIRFVNDAGGFCFADKCYGKTPELIKARRAVTLLAGFMASRFIIDDYPCLEDSFEISGCSSDFLKIVELNFNQDKLLRITHNFCVRFWDYIEVVAMALLVKKRLTRKAFLNIVSKRK